MIWHQITWVYLLELCSEGKKQVLQLSGNWLLDMRLLSQWQSQVTEFFPGLPHNSYQRWSIQQGAHYLWILGLQTFQALQYCFLFCFALFFGHFVGLFAFAFFFFSFKATPMAYGGFQARGIIRAVATAYSTATAMPLWPIPQITTTQDPWPAEWGQGANTQPHGP